MHVLHRTGPRALQHAAPVTEIPPGQRVGAERLRRGFISQRRNRATRRNRGCLRRILSHWCNFLSESGKLTTCVVNKSLGVEVPSGQRSRRWSGVPLEDRQALRRDDLVAAGVQLLGQPSGPAVTVRAVCRQAELTERYFYESFSDRDEFVRAVYDDVCARAMSALRSATTPREAVERFVALMVDDPERGRVLLLAPAVEPVLTRSGADWMPSFIDLLQRKLTQIGDPVRQNMIATSLIGALTALFTAYLDRRLTATRKEFIDYCVAMLLSRASYPESSSAT